MNNPLTLEERLSVTQLLDHDLGTARAILVSQVLLQELSRNEHTANYALKRLKPELQKACMFHIWEIIDSVGILTNDGYSSSRPIDQEYFETELAQLKLMFGLRRVSKEAEIQYASNITGKFNSYEPLLYSVLYNLVKNSLGATKQKGKIRLTVTNYSGSVQNPIFASNETPLEGDFVKLTVTDDGQGFPEDKSLKDFLNLGTTTKKAGTGFGLYYVGLVCKFLRGHLTIDSKPGDTNVTIYHPLNLK